MNESGVFAPDWASPPGDTVSDILNQRYLSIGDFAERLGQPMVEATALLEGRTRVTPEIATRLATILGGSEDFWINRDRQYLQDLHRRESRAAYWLRQLPLAEMVRLGWVQRPGRDRHKMTESLRFFGVPNISFWEKRYGRLRESAALRLSPAFASKPVVIAAWFRQGEIQAAAIKCAEWNAEQLRKQLPELRKLTKEKDPTIFLPQLADRCAMCGVAVVVVRAPQGCPASGATRFVQSNKAILQLSFRYLTDDQFWFTFFHEIGHLLLHGHDGVFLEGSEAPETKEEAEANAFSEALLIPSEFRGSLLRIQPTVLNIARIARELGISPGIVVGQLQHYNRVSPRHFNRLKVRYQWSA
jgi:HTH-type transcriptional regulator / antitoxin HigA